MAKALILGFGGSGAQTLTFVKEIAVWKEGKTPEQVSFLLFDTIEGWKAGKTVQFLGGRGTETLAKSRDEAANLNENSEYFHLGDQDPNLNRRVTDATLPVHLAPWLHAQWLALHVPEAARSIKDGAAQQRQIGRFAIFQNAVRMRSVLGDIFRKTKATNVWLVGSAAGGTGAGGLLDAALLVRLAARDSGIAAPKITGVVVLPDVYADKDGIRKARAYALLRELARLQENGFDASEDAFRGDSGNITVRVRYDSSNQITATRNLGGLFDCVFYVSDACRDDGARESFFSSLANAIDPYLDPMAGPSLLQGSVNEGGKLPSSFGASRIYLPMQTLADLYGWEEVRAYLEAITAPKLVADRVVDVSAGAETDLATKARETVALLLPFFGYLDNVKLTVEPEKWKEVGLSLTPLRVVEEHLQFASAQQAGLKLGAGDAQLVGHTYRNPYVSLTASEDMAKPETWRLRTHDQFRKSGEREAIEESQQRFQRELESITSSYRSAQLGEKSFGKGAELVRQKLTARLQERVDELVMTAFEADSIGRRAEGEGTVLTILYKLLEEALGDGGPIRNARAVLTVMRETVREQESRLGQKLQQVQADLKQWTPSKWSLTNASTLSALQTDVASAAGKAAVAFQRYRLLELVADLLDLAEARLTAWHAQAKAMLNGLLLDPGTGAAYGRARGAIGELETRLGRQAANRLAVIDPVRAREDQAGKTDLNGYRDILKRDLTTLPAGVALHEDGVAKSQWEALVDAGNRPRLVLKTDAGSYDDLQLGNFALDLHRGFRRHVDRVVATKDIFDYLHFCQSTANLKPEEIARILDSRAKALINLPNAREEKYLTYATPQGANALEHSNFGQAISGHIAGMQYYAHSDRFSICLLKVKKPANAIDIQDVEECLKDYLELQTGRLNDVQLDDYVLRRAEVYHIFRAELEAWYIEREALLNRHVQATPDDHIPPRIVRLLDDPERMSAFVKCLATGAVFEDDKGWWWRAPGGDKVPLTDPNEGKTTMVRAAVNFVLRGEGGTVMGSRTIPIQDVNRSIAEVVAKAKKSEPDLLNAFAKNIDGFLDRSFANLRGASDKQYKLQRDGLKTVLKFYATPGRSTDLVKRMLP
jgi:Tubulin like